MFHQFFGQGVPGGDPQPPQPPAKADDGPDYFELLGVERDATAKEIRKAYLKKARTVHPDRGGNAEDFQELEEAKSVLLDEERRELYERYGKDAAAQGRPPAASGLEAFFGGAFGRQPQGRPKLRPGKPMVYPMRLTLEQLYSGVTKKLRITRSVIESEDGVVVEDERGTKKACTSCDDCDGAGFKTEMQQMGGAMFRQLRRPCAACGGAGFTLRPGFRTSQCAETVTAYIAPGARHGERVRVGAYGDHELGCLPSELFVEVQQLDHATFQRRGTDLLLRKKLSLRDALCGIEIRVATLDGRSLRIPCGGCGAVLRPDTVKAVVGEGMPVPGDHFGRGRLFVHFDVEWPNDGALQAEQLTAIDAALQPASGRAVVPVTRAADGVAAAAAEKASGHSAQMEAWRRKKVAAWKVGEARLRAKCATRAALDAWMERQCAKALARAGSGSGSGSSEESAEDCGAAEAKGNRKGEEQDEEEQEDDAEVVQLENVDIQSFGKHGAPVRSAYDDDDSEGGREGCAMQ